MNCESWVEPAIEAVSASELTGDIYVTTTYRLVSLQSSLNRVKNLRKEVWLRAWPQRRTTKWRMAMRRRRAKA
jgi:hypothetical protein